MDEAYGYDVTTSDDYIDTQHEFMTRSEEEITSEPLEPVVDTCGIYEDFPILQDLTPNRRHTDLLGDEVISIDPNERPESLNIIFETIDQNADRYIHNLREAVSIRSISAWPEARNECFRMVQWTTARLEQLGFQVELRKVGEQEIGGKTLQVPPIIMASFITDPSRVTVLVYGHLDVMPAKLSESWATDPFILSEEDGKLIGRGASDNKGPVLGWLHAVEAYLLSSIEIPINIKIILETMLETGSEGLDDLLKAQKNEFLSDVDLVVISDNFWLSNNKPCITYGLRGLCYFFVEVECGSKDLHSGVFGGAVREALPDLLWLLDQLQDKFGNILIPGIMDNVCPVLPAEEVLLEDVEFDLHQFKEDAGAVALRFEGNKIATLMARWRLPALTIHGIQGAYSAPGSSAVIPRKVIGKFSIRIVPNQKPDRIDKMVTDYLREKWQERGSPNKLEIYMADDGIAPFCANPFHPSFRAARQATAWAYEVVPDMTREGGTLERLLLLQEITGKNILLMPMGANDDKPHCSNEKINVTNYITGTKQFAAFIHEISFIEKASL